MALGGAAVTVLAGFAPPEPVAADPTEPSAPTHEAPAEAKLTTIVVDAEGLDGQALMDALRLRLDDRAIVDVHQPRPGRFAYVHVDRVPPATVRITLVETSGRAYDRTLDHEPDQAVRVAAAALATLLASIESGNATPDRENAAIPQPPPAETPEPEPIPEPAPPPPPQPETTAPAPTLPSAWLGVTSAGSIVLGVAPTTAAGAFGGGAAALALTVRLARGPLVGVGLRATHRERHRLQGTRLRIAAGGGYAWSWAHFELAMVGSATVEPWWVRRTGSVIDLDIAGRPATRRPLLGAEVLVQPGWSVTLASGLALRLGPRVALAGSFVPERGARTARIDSTVAGQAPRAALRLGGLELDLGAELTVWTPVLARKKTPAPRNARR